MRPFAGIPQFAKSYLVFFGIESITDYEAFSVYR